MVFFVDHNRNAVVVRNKQRAQILFRKVGAYQMPFDKGLSVNVAKVGHKHKLMLEIGGFVGALHKIRDFFHGDSLLRERNFRGVSCKAYP